MGCGASTVELPHNIYIGRWSQGDVSAWFRTLPPDLSRLSTQLLPADGCLLLEWDEKVLVSSGVSVYQAKQLMLLRSDLMAACHQGAEATEATGATEATRRCVIVGPDKIHKTTQSLTQTLLIVARKSLPAAAEISRQLGEVLPFPGQGADLALRAAEMMDLVSHSREELTNGNLAFKALVGRFSDLLQEIQNYCQQFSDRNFLIRIFESSGDQDYQRELVDKLSELRGDANLAVAVKTIGVVLEVKEQVVQVNSLAADWDMGEHRIIKHSDLKVFWRQFFAGRDCVPWKLWWVQFPSELGESCPQMREEDIKKLEECLESREAKDVFEAALERANPDNISVDEVKLSFPPGAELVQHIVSMIGHRDASSSTDTTPKLLTVGVSLGFGLPSVDPLYVERERGYVEGLIRKMVSPGNDSASAGCVSCMCLAGGAVMVDLREARSLLDLAGRFCVALSEDKTQWPNAST
eukprot:gene11989-15084_t